MDYYSKLLKAHCTYTMCSGAENNCSLSELHLDEGRLEAILQGVFKTNSRLLSVKCKRAVEGFLSTAVSAQLTWEPSESSSGLPSYVFIKSPSAEKVDGFEQDKKAIIDAEPVELVAPAQFDFLSFAHNQECRVYELFSRNPPVKLPKYYYSEPRKADQAGLIILEDLSSVARTQRIAVGLNAEQLRTVIRQLAALHAYSLKDPDWNSSAHLEFFPQSEMKVIAKDTLRMGKILLTTPEAQSVLSVTEEQLEGLCDIDEVLELMDPAEGLACPVLVHGDLWASNVLFCTDEPDHLAAIIDWQFAHPGPPAEDFVTLLQSSVDPTLRRRLEYELIEAYWAELKCLLAVHAVEVPFTADDVKRWYKRIFQFGVVQLIQFVAAVITIDGSKYTTDEKEIFLERLQACIDDVQPFTTE